MSRLLLPVREDVTAAHGSPLGVAAGVDESGQLLITVDISSHISSAAAKGSGSKSRVKMPTTWKRLVHVSGSYECVVTVVVIFLLCLLLA